VKQIRRNLEEFEFTEATNYRRIVVLIEASVLTTEVYFGAEMARDLFDAFYSKRVKDVPFGTLIALRSVTQEVSRVLRDRVRPRPGVNRALSDIG
jgi:hypothetical protein